MATSRISINTNLSTNTREQRQAQARIRALQRRTNALYEDLSRSSLVAKTAVDDFKHAYMTITNEFQEQRNQLLQRLQHIKQDIKQSTSELDNIHKNLHSTQSHHVPRNASRSSNDLDIHQMNDMINEVDRVLDKIAQQLKTFRAMPTNDQSTSRPFVNKFAKDTSRKGMGLKSTAFYPNQFQSTNVLFIRKLYTTDVDISPQWVVSSIDKRIFLCDTEGELRIFSFARSFRRQPLLTEHFRLATMRLISSFTVTHDYLVAFESDTQTLTLHTHHGSILLRLAFSYDPVMIVRSDYHKKNRIWACSRSKRKCFKVPLDHAMKEVHVLDELDFSQPINNCFTDAIGVATDEQDRIAIHDINSTTMDRLLLVTNQQTMVITLDFIKYLDSLSTSRIERVLLVPKHSHLIVIVYASKISIANIREIVIVDISLQPAQILYRLAETNGVQGIDVTQNGELVYTVPTQKNKRIATKMHIYSLFD